MVRDATSFLAPGAPGADRRAMAGDLLLLARLHEHALDRDMLAWLWSCCYDGLFVFGAHDARLRQLTYALCNTLTRISACLDTDGEAVFAADFERSCRSFARAVATVRDASETRLSRRSEGHGTCARVPSRGDCVPAEMLRQLAARLIGDGVSEPAAVQEAVIGAVLVDAIERHAERVAAVCCTSFYRELAAVTACYLRATWRGSECDAGESYRRPSIVEGAAMPALAIRRIRGRRRLVSVE